VSGNFEWGGRCKRPVGGSIVLTNSNQAGSTGNESHKHTEVNP